jgi:hypothetical protein
MNCGINTQSPSSGKGLKNPFRRQNALKDTAAHGRDLLSEVE